MKGFTRWESFQHGLGAYGWRAVAGLLVWWVIIIGGITWLYWAGAHESDAPGENYKEVQ